MLRNYGFSDLIGVNSEVAAGPDVAGGPEDMSVCVEVEREIVLPGHAGDTRKEMVISVSKGLSRLADMMVDLEAQFRWCGNHHWGDISDVVSLSKNLQIGMLLFVDKLQAAGSQCLCTLDEYRGDFKFFIVVWWDDPIHFRLGQLKLRHAWTFDSHWAAQYLPAPLVAHYNACNPTARIGASTSLGVS